MNRGKIFVKFLLTQNIRTAYAKELDSTHVCYRNQHNCLE